MLDHPDTPVEAAPAKPDPETLAQIEQRVLWLATRIVDEANRRPGGDLKVGGHQASSASMVSIMTALWFGHIGGADKVAVKPHASPVFHAIKYLTGELDRSYLTSLRQRGGLQAYPSRTKDPDVADFSTGSVGLGAVAPLFSALTRRYVDHHLRPSPDSSASARFIALVGDAELDEGNVWEAVSEPATEGLGNFTMVVDLNRQSLDRVIPGIRVRHPARVGSSSTAGWQVAGGEVRPPACARPSLDAMDGARRAPARFDRRHDERGVPAPRSAMAGADLLRAHLLERGRCRPDRDPTSSGSLRRMSSMTDVPALLADLGGHDHDELARLLEHLRRVPTR